MPELNGLALAAYIFTTPSVYRPLLHVGVGRSLCQASSDGGMDAESGASTGGGVPRPAAERRGGANAIFSWRSRGCEDVSPCQGCGVLFVR